MNLNDSINILECASINTENNRWQWQSGGKKNLVIYFYPKDDTPGCTVETKDFERLLSSFAKTSTEVVGISRDTLKSHLKFSEKHALSLPLLADVEKTICAQFGVLVEKSMFGRKYMGIDRTTFLINKDGVVVKIWRKVKVDGHAQEVMNYCQSIL